MARMSRAASGSKDENTILRLGCAMQTARMARSSATKRRVSQLFSSSNLSSMLKPSSFGVFPRICAKVGISSSTSMTHG